MVKPLLGRRERTALLQCLHECIEKSLPSLPECACQGLRCRTLSRAKLLVHFAISSYVADPPETEDLLLLK